MKNKTKKFIQHLSHDIEDADFAQAYLDESLPLIGLVVMCCGFQFSSSPSPAM